MKCPQCASLMMDDCRYCPQCGKSTVLAGSDALTIPLDSEMFAALSGAKSAPARSRPADSRRDAGGHTLLAEANLFRIRRQYTQAIDNCVEALRTQPGDQAAHSLLGDIYRDQGKTDDAIQWYRMALDLGPNASDEAKLKKQEQERARKANASTQGRNNTRYRLAPISASGSLPAGTVYLMGISPRRWLHGITVASLCFLGLLLLALSYTKMTHPRESVPQTVASESPVVTVNGGGILPDARPGGGSVASGAAPVASAAVGSGLRPDLVPPRGAASGAHRANPPVRPKTSTNSPSGTPSSGTPLAPVLSVKPLPAETEPVYAGSTSHFGFGETAQGASMLNSLNGLVLPGGFRITHVAPQPAANAAALMLTAPAAETQRDALLRGLYRAARAAFDADPNVTRVTVSVTSEANAASLVTADVDRIAALTASPDSEAPESLESRLLSVHWSALPPVAAPEAAPGNSIRILPSTPAGSS